MTEHDEGAQPAVPRWVAGTAVAGTVLIALGAFWLSFTALTDLATRAGIPGKPAQFTRPSSPPNASTAACTIASAPSGSATEPTLAAPSPPAAASSPTSPSSRVAAASAPPVKHRTLIH